MIRLLELVLHGKRKEAAILAAVLSVKATVFTIRAAWRYWRKRK